MNHVCGIHSPNDPSQASLEFLACMLSASNRGPAGAARTLSDPESGIALGQIASDRVNPTWYEDEATVTAFDGFLADDPPIECGARARPAESVSRLLEESEVRFPGPLSGHFGLAAWSRDSRTLRLARDPLGGKCLYCYHDAPRGLSVFSSEIKSIVAHPAVPRRVDRDALAVLMAFGYLPAPMTPFEGIRKLGPGELLELDRRGVARSRRFWSMPPDVPRPADATEFARETRSLVLERFERHLDGHRKIGLFLSGGVDSTIALGVLKLLGVPELHTYAFGFRIGAPRLSEDLVWARRAAEALGARFRPVVVERGADPLPSMTRVFRHFDDPVLSPNVHSRYLLAAAARDEGVPVCIGGTTAGSFFGTLSDSSLAKLREKAGNLNPLELMTYRSIRIFSFDELEDLLTEAPTDVRSLSVEAVKHYADEIPARCVGDQMTLTKALINGAEKSVATQERTARLAGVSMRQPFRDLGLLAFARTIPPDLKGAHDSSKSKFILKTAFADVLPEDIATRPKIGYPSYYWNGGELDSLAQSLLSPEAIERAGMFRPDAVRQILRADRESTKKSAGKKTWALLAAQAWHAIHVERRADLV